MSLAAWFAARANVRAGTGSARIVVAPADSLSAGFNSTNDELGSNAVSLSWPMQMAAAFATAPARADSWIGDGHASDPGVGQLLSDYDNRIAENGSWVQNPPEAPGGYVVAGATAMISTNGTNDLTVDFDVVFDTVEVYFVPYSGSPECTINLNGGSSVGTVDQDATPTGFTRQVFTGLSRGNNVLHINPPAADAVIIGAAVMDSMTPRVNVFNAAWSGSTTESWVTDTPDGFSAVDFLAAMDPDLIIHFIGGNDCGAAVAEGTFKTRLGVSIDASIATGASVLVVGFPFHDATAFGQSEATQATYSGYIADVCVTKGVQYLPMQSRAGWTSFAIGDGNGYYSSDDVHPSAAGYADMALAVREIIDPPVVDSVTPGTFADTETGIVIAGAGFSGSGNSVFISPVNAVGGETSVAPEYISNALGGTTTTTSYTITIPTVEVGDLLVLEHCHRGTGNGSVSDNNSGSWNHKHNQPFASSAFSGNLWWRRAISGDTGKTITGSSLTDSCAGILTVYRDVIASGDPFDNAATIVGEQNASGNETQAQITTLVDNCMVCLTVLNSPDLAVATQAATNPATLTERAERLSTGGTDASIAHASAVRTTAGATGSLTWTQTNAASGSYAYAIQPRAPLGASAEQTVTSESTTSITFTADQDTLDDSVDLYLFVVNDDGSVSWEGEVVQFEAGGGGGAPWVPAYLSMLRANQ